MKRNHSIDILKVICSFLVIIIHISWNFKAQILPLTRCAVPCFFMISGFFLYQDGGIKLSKVTKTLKNMFKITLWFSLLFVVYSEYLNIKGNNELFIPAIRSVCSWIFCNNFPFAYHLWYLYAYIYVLSIVYFVEKYRKWKLLFTSIPILLSMSVVFYLLPFVDIEIPLPIFRNFLFIGLPFFALGSFIKSRYHLIIRKINIKYLTCCSIILMFLTIFEAMFLINIGEDPYKEIYLCTPILSVILFLIFLSIKVDKPNWLSMIGEQDTLYIYLLHPIFTYIVFLTSITIGIVSIVNWISPFAVFIVTLIFLHVFRRYIKSTKYKKESTASCEKNDFAGENSTVQINRQNVDDVSLL